MMKFWRKWQMAGMLALALMGVGTQPAVSAETAEGGVPLGAEVAAKEQAYAKGVTLAPMTLHGVAVSQDRSKPVPAAFANPAERLCKPFCVQPASIDGATTFTLEDFSKHAEAINSGKLLIVDMRTPDWFEKGTLPGAISLPYSDLTGPKTKAMAKLKRLEGKDVVVFCNGWWCGQSPTGIKALVELGFPGKIYYFRGGNQDWVDAGLPLVAPH
ncbi:MAG: rhodanese-like domain-containing protein [Magnetococcus sp. WYHC-3]